MKCNEGHPLYGAYGCMTYSLGQHTQAVSFRFVDVVYVTSIIGSQLLHGCRNKHFESDDTKNSGTTSRCVWIRQCRLHYLFASPKVDMLLFICSPCILFFLRTNEFNVYVCSRLGVLFLVNVWSFIYSSPLTTKRHTLVNMNCVGRVVFILTWISYGLVGAPWVTTSLTFLYLCQLKQWEIWLRRYLWALPWAHVTLMTCML